MNLKRSIEALKSLKAEILEDGVIDFNETTQILDFVGQYLSPTHRIFTDFKTLVESCRKDGKITADESAIMEVAINNLLTFMQTLLIMKTVAIGLVVTSLAVIAICICI